VTQYVKVTGYLEIEDDEAATNGYGQIDGLTAEADAEHIGPAGRTRLSDLEDITISEDDR
jgi:hypothetical protein